MSESARKLLITEIIFSFGTMLFIILYFIASNDWYMTVALLTGSVMLGLMSARRLVEGRKGFGALIAALAVFVFFSAILDFI
ncbi:hypothetical protein [Alkalibacillus salilacus]|uniref:VIT1/CCC1 family predicted Fe2+/Mn2+ transporter n=1 Tax=Alkalibacillus salilacus TaxID=284582 RepID=A0ABT9VH90_9BACI|nr:hypothetical protein [Alkalibacillus salilacus]MDQ0160331.1 VIT1/CCC1 family predicted Fe2+/Mn2+ transporter [Alkalibacillus salilacus]